MVGSNSDSLSVEKGEIRIRDMRSDTSFHSAACANSFPQAKATSKNAGIVSVFVVVCILLNNCLVSQKAGPDLQVQLLLHPRW